MYNKGRKTVQVPPLNIKKRKIQVGLKWEAFLRFHSFTMFYDYLEGTLYVNKWLIFISLYLSKWQKSVYGQTLKIGILCFDANCFSLIKALLITLFKNIHLLVI